MYSSFNPQMPPLEISDFSGGKTDNYLDAAINKYQEADNLLITPNKKFLTRPGQVFYDEDNPQLPSANSRVSTLIPHRGDQELFAQNQRNLYYILSGAWSALTGPTGNPVMGAGTTANRWAWAEWNKHLMVTSDAFASPQKIYKDDTSTWRVRNAGLPALATAPIVTAGAAGANSYLYRFVYHYAYMVGTVSFEDFGPTTEVALTAAAAPDINPVAITGIPVLANGATENWDTSVIKVKIYRTVNAGTTFYYVGEVTNGTTIYNDNSSDTTIQNNNILLYTEGGVVDNDPPPQSKFVVVCNDITWYLHVKEGTSIYSSRVRQSLKFDPDSAPGSFFIDVEDEILGGSAIGVYPIIFCRNSIYRLEGFFDELGRGGIQKREVSRSIGGINHLSIVPTLTGIYFAGTGGFYWTDGYQVVKLTKDLPTSYKGITELDSMRANIYGIYDDLENRVWWACEEDTATLDNDACWVLDLNHRGINEDAPPPFTTMSGGVSFQPTALCFFNREIVRADSRGYIFKFDNNTKTDPRVDTNVTPADWEEQAIIYTYDGPAINFGTSSVKKWVPVITAEAQNVTNISFAIWSNNNDSGFWRMLKEIRFRENLVWGDDSIYWGDLSSPYPWNSSKLIDGVRRFPAGGIRCMMKQIRITNSFTIIQNSDTLGTATVDGVANTAVLDDILQEWPFDAVDYFISFASDNYTAQYLITDRTATTITLSDSLNTIPTGVLEWEIQGYRKGEVLNLLHYSLYYSPIAPTQGRYKAMTGANV